MRNSTRLLGTLLALVWLLAGQAEAGKLSRAREQVRSTPPAKEEEPLESKPAGKLSRARKETRQTPSRPKARHDDHDTRRHHDHRAGWHASATLFDTGRGGWCYPPVVTPVCAAPAPAVVYVEPPAVEYQITPADFGPPTESFASHPFANGADGFFTQQGGKPWLGKLQVEFGDASDGVSRTGVAFLLEGEGGFGIDFDWDAYTEELPGGGHDELHLGQVNFLYRIAETDRSLVRAGVGVGWLGDAIGTEAGLNLTVQADLLLGRDWVASVDCDFGTLGDAQTQHVSGTIGRRFGSAEVYGGYDHRRLGEVSLQGPTVGIRLWW